MDFKATKRGFHVAEFADRNGVKCSLQESSLATERCVWFGCSEIGLKRFTPGKGWEDVELQQDAPHGITHLANTRMHLTQEVVQELLPALQHFAATGELPKPETTPEPVDASRLERLLDQDAPLDKSEVQDLREWLDVLRLDCELFGETKEDRVRMSTIQLKIDTNA